MQTGLPHRELSTSKSAGLTGQRAGPGAEIVAPGGPLGSSCDRFAQSGALMKNLMSV